MNPLYGNFQETTGSENDTIQVGFRNQAKTAGRENQTIQGGNENQSSMKGNGNRATQIATEGKGALKLPMGLLSKKPRNSWRKWLSN
jgi:hypothetical protein